MEVTAPKGLLLQEREVELILLVYKYNGVTIDLIQRRFWPQAKSKSTYYLRIQSLIKHGYLKSNRVSNPHSGYFGVLWLTIGPRSKELIADALAIPLEQVKESSRTISPI